MISKDFFIPVKPQPASRPRISKYGNYYPKAYSDFRKEMFLFLRQFKGEFKPIDKVGFYFYIEIICKKPKKPTNIYPRGDVDNYVKGYLDSITYTKLFWEDDIQIIELEATKRYQNEGEDYGAKIRVRQLESICNDKAGK